ncbi:armadillo-type protein [Gaertneriomyces semiglobifer]|nr:armadillo-type protein [Gaertneriomyces semiglobifer]
MSANHVKRKRATSSNEDPASKNAPNEPELGSDDVSETETHESSSSEYSDSEAEGEQVPAKRVKTAEEEEKNRKSRAEQKTLLQERKLAKPKAPLIQQAKKIWERLRQKELKREERRQLMEELMPLLRGNVKDIIFKHDASRVVQCAVKYGSSSQRDELAEELKGSYVELSKSLYGRFLISKILKYCSAVYRHAVIQDFYGKVRRMIRHKDASMVLEEAYSQYANSQQRAALLEEFYGPEFALFKHAGGHSLQDLLKENPHKKPAIMRHLRETLISILGKGFTSIGHLTIVHKALLEYFTYAEEKQLVEMMEFVKEHLVSILHTREGARVAQLCITHAGPKDRKIIIKSMKDYVRKVAMEQYGHAVLLSIFECVDDTVLVDKAILCELTRDGLTAGERFSDILKDRYGGRVVLYLLCGRNRKYQPQYVIDELRDLDVIRAKTSKKDDSTRHQQLLKAISPALLTSLTENCEELIRDDNGSAVLKEAFFVAEGAYFILDLRRDIAYANDNVPTSCR